MAAGTEIERLFVKIEGDLSGLNASMAKAGDTVDRAQKGMEASLGRMGRAFKTAGAAMAGVFGVTSVATAVAGVNRLQQGAMDYASAIKDAAIQTGFGTTALQELQFQAVRMGLSEESLSNGLRRMNQKIGEARTEGGAAAQAFQRLGVELADASGNALGNESVFRSLIERLKAVQDPAIRAANAFELFGREAGPKFLELIGEGTAGLDKYAAAAHKAGTVLDEQYIESLKKAQEELAVLDKQIEVNTARAFGTTEPIMRQWKETLQSITATLAEMKEDDSFQQGMAVLAGTTMPRTQQATQAVVDVLYELERRWGSINDAGPLNLEVRSQSIPFAPGKDANTPAPAVEDPEVEKQRLATEAYVRDWHERVQAQMEAEDEIADYNEAALEEERRRSDEYTELWWSRVEEQMDAEEALAQFEEQKNAERFAAAKGALGNLSTLMASENRKMFEVGKAAAIAETIINTYEAAQKAFTSLADIPYVGPALGAAAAAAAIAGGLARVQAIKNTSFGSRSVNVGVGNNVSVGSSAGGAGAGAGGGASGNIYISLKGQDLFSGDAVRQLIERISEAQGDGSRIAVVS